MGGDPEDVDVAGADFDDEQAVQALDLEQVSLLGVAYLLDRSSGEQPAQPRGH